MISDDVSKYEDCKIHSTPIHIYQEFLETLKKYGSMAIHDDHKNWRENDFHREVSKVLLID